MPAHLELYFSGTPIPELQKTIFVCPWPLERLVACRQQRGSAFQQMLTGQFVWTASLQVATELLLRTAAADRAAYQRNAPETLEGGERSAAGTLYRAITQEPNWLLDIMGVSARGESNAKRVFRRTKTGSGSESELCISVDREFLPGGCITVFIDGAELTSGRAIFELAHCISGHLPRTSSADVARWIGRAGKNSSDRYDTSNAQLIWHEVNVRVTVLNTRGDAEIYHEKEVENVGVEEVTSAAFDVWLDSSYSDVRVDAWLDDGRAVQAAVVNNQQAYKRFKIAFPEPIPPSGRKRYSYRYIIPGIFGGPGELNTWTLQLREPTVSLTMEVLDTRYRAFENVITIHESDDRRALDRAIKTALRASKRGPILSWQRNSPPPGHVFKTYWVGSERRSAGLSDAETHRNNEMPLGLC